MGDILIIAVGRKKGLVQAFKESARRFDAGPVIGTDCDITAPAALTCDTFACLPRSDSRAFLPALRALLATHQPELIVPTREADLPRWARFARVLPCAVAVSSPPLLRQASDKLRCERLLQAAGLPHPGSVPAAEAQRHPERFPLPMVAKARCGSGSTQVRVLESRRELMALPPDWLVQPLLSGDEFTINLYIDRAGRLRCVIPHQRLAVDRGEVSHGITVVRPDLIALAERLAAALPQAWGPLNFQVIVDERRGPVITDLNPRFGGGYPLAHAAGARFTDWLLLESRGQPLPEKTGQWLCGVELHRKIDHTRFHFPQAQMAEAKSC